MVQNHSRNETSLYKRQQLTRRTVSTTLPKWVLAVMRLDKSPRDESCRPSSQSFICFHLYCSSIEHSLPSGPSLNLYPRSGSNLSLNLNSSDLMCLVWEGCPQNMRSGTRAEIGRGKVTDGDGDIVPFALTEQVSDSSFIIPTKWEATARSMIPTKRKEAHRATPINRYEKSYDA